MKNFKLYPSMLLAFYCLITSGCGEKAKEDLSFERIGDSMYALIPFENSDEAIYCRVNSDGALLLQPKWMLANDDQILIYKDMLEYSQISENGYVNNEKLYFYNLGESIVKQGYKSVVDSTWYLTYLAHWINPHTINASDGNMMAFQVIPGDTLKFGIKSNIKIHCLDMDDWSTFVDVEIHNDNGNEAVFSGVVHDFEKIPIDINCIGNWHVSSVVRRMDTVENVGTDGFKVGVIRDTMKSDFYVSY